MHHYIIKLIIIQLLLLPCLTSTAMPAFPAWLQRTLSDGTTIKVMPVGDEHGHWFVDETGRALASGSDGHLYYLSNNQLQAKQNQREKRFRMINEKRMAFMNEMRNQSVLGAKADGFHQFDNISYYQGKKRCIVILVEFPDAKFSVAPTSRELNALYEKRFNAQGPPAKNYVGSVRDYFLDQSYGQLDITFDIIGPITLSRESTYYGKNDSDGDDCHPCEMVIEAVKMADSLGVDFSLYDWRNRGVVDQIFVIYAGEGENRTLIDDHLWPHAWDLSSGESYGDGTGKQIIDGMEINQYAISPELAYTAIIDGIGTACHEFSHCLGFPDLYDTTYSNLPTPGYWDLMDSGSYNGPMVIGEVPAGMSSHERWQAGWLQPMVLDNPSTICDMPALENEPVAYVIYNDAHPEEHFMLENRQPIKWDSYITYDQSAHGMLIVHIDYDREKWIGNTVNNTKGSPGCLFVPADNSYGYKIYRNEEQRAGDPFPGSHNVHEFTDVSTPAATLYHTNTDGSHLLHKPITGITETSGRISFNFMEDPSGIVSVTTPTNDHPQTVYSLHGQRLGYDTSRLKPGIYIIGNQKKGVK